MSWDADAGAAAQVPVATGLLRGARGRCPACGQGALFRGYLKPADECRACHAPLGRIRADDAPPYFTIFLAGHVLLPVAFMVERIWHPEVWVHMAIWLPAYAIACTLLLRPVKGMVIAWMMRLGLTGDEQGPPVPVAAPRTGTLAAPREGPARDA